MKKKKLTGSLPAKIAAICLVIVCLLLSAVSAAAVVVLDNLGVYSRDEETLLDEYQDIFLERYSIYAIANYMEENGDMLQKLDETNFRYGIIQTKDFDAIDLNDASVYLAGNIDQEIDRKSVNVYSCVWNKYTRYRYEMNLLGYAFLVQSAADSANYEEYSVDAYYYNRTDERLYMKVGELLYPYDSYVGVVLGDSSDDVVWETDDADDQAIELWGNGTTSTVAEEADLMLLDNSWLNQSQTDWGEPFLWIYLPVSDLYLRAADVAVVDDDELLSLGKRADDAQGMVFLDNGNIGIASDADLESDSYYVVSYVNEPLEAGETFAASDLFVQAKLLADDAYTYRFALAAGVFVFAILAVAAFVFLMHAAGRKNGVEELCAHPWDAVWLDVNLCFAAAISIALVFAAAYVFDYYEPLKSMTFWLVALGAFTVAILLFIEWSMSLALWWKRGGWWRHTLCYVLFKYCKKGCTALGRGLLCIGRGFLALVHSVRFLWKAWLILAVIFGVELAAAFLTDSEELAIFFCVEKLVCDPPLIFALIQLNRLRESGKKLAAGELTEKIDTSHMYWEFRQHGENLNAIGDGINAAVGERMKSERFKTELITNVSHDIKTPLTSIINYVDLLGREQFDNPKAAEYLEVLNRQSARLKKLIEDLIEASKASTGNLKVCMEVCDAKVTLVQTIGEYEEKLAGSQIELFIKEPAEKICIEADSRHLWRVFDNLMNNICKYAQPLTRAYVNLEREDGRAVITFRNISKEPLNITSEELLERFVRGDGSRSTEGNGLGLSIARSLTELMGGTLKLVVDGDLFKVVLSFPVLKE